MQLLLEDFVEGEVDALLRDALHQVHPQPFVETREALFPEGALGHLKDAAVFSLPAAVTELVLLDAGANGGDWVAGEGGEELAEAAAEEVLFAERGLGDSCRFVEYFGSLVGVHLHYSGEGEEEAELEALQEAPPAMLSSDFFHRVP